jgi:hypothetical protein
MKSRATFCITGFMLVVMMFSATLAHAATATILPSGNGIYVVQGADLDQVAAVEIVVGYDATTLANPRVAKGDLISNILMVANTSQKGIVRIAAINPYPKVKTGSGIIATISFDLLKSPGKITSFNPYFDDVNGAPLNPQAIIVPGGDGKGGDGKGGGGTGGGGTSVTTGGSTSAAGPNVIGGSVTLPSDGSLTPEKTREETPQAEAGSKGSVGAPAEGEDKEGQQGRVASLPPAGKKMTVHKSILERFREFQGVKNPKALMALFTSDPMPGIRQEPPIAISDGKTSLKVFIDLPAAGNETPNFTIKGAQMVSAKMAENAKWVIEALPETGVYDASITVMQGQFTTEIPLAVAPRAAISTGKTRTTDEAGFAFFLKTRGSAKSPRFDLNGDGVRNYIDDYIFTANYLAEQGSKSPARDKKTP